MERELNGMVKRTLILIVSIAWLATACTPPPTAVLAADAGLPVEQAPAGAAPPPGYAGRTWDDILMEARGGTVNFYMWGSNELTNTWVTGFAAGVDRRTAGMDPGQPREVHLRRAAGLHRQRLRAPGVLPRRRRLRTVPGRFQ
jgi:hypothetical protein